MGRIDVILPDDIEDKFRNAVYKRYGMKRGNITEAINNAIIDWVNENSPIDKIKKNNQHKVLSSKHLIDK
ncbi:MAG: hypothetical protein ACREA3_03430 [Nitrosotalea sp.]